MKGKWGVMTHYLLAWQAREFDLPMTAEQWNEMVDNFDVEGLADQIKSTGASYHILTIGQGTTHFLTPSPLFDSLFTTGPSNCSRRDLIADMAKADAKRGIKLIVYSTTGPPRGAKDIGTTNGNPPGDYRNKKSMLAWENVIKEWSLRWGDKISGWWFDGCYTPNKIFNYPDSPNFQSFAASARAGNHAAAVTFNRGVMDRPISITPYEDYTGGEINDIHTARLWRVEDGKVDGARLHMLSYLGQKWGVGEPRYDDLSDIVILRTVSVLELGGAMTWDVPVQPSGIISGAYMKQLIEIGKAVDEMPEGTYEELRAQRIQNTNTQLKEISNSIERFKADFKRYPTTEEGLNILLKESNLKSDKNWKGPYLHQIPKDAFSCKFRYIHPSKRGSGFDLISSGPDREFNTGDDIYLK
jgi:type II secretion system protein G